MKGIKKKKDLLQPSLWLVQCKLLLSKPNEEAKANCIIIMLCNLLSVVKSSHIHVSGKFLRIVGATDESPAPGCGIRFELNVGDETG